MDEGHKAVTVIIADEAELTVGHLLIRRYINHVILVTITVHIVAHKVRGVVATAPSLIDQAIMVAALVVNSSTGHETVRCHILRVMQTHIVRTLCAGDVGECR